MSATPFSPARPSLPAAAPAPAAGSIFTDDQRAFIELLYGDGSGYLEICYIAGDPAVKVPLKRACWMQYTVGTIGQIAARIAQLATRYGNVYISSALYSRRIRNRTYALPSRILFADDAPSRGPLAYSVSVRTSEHSHHAYYVLDRAVDPDTRQQLQKSIAHRLGADRSGADVEQVVRVPDTWNTKHGARFPVTLERLTTYTYSVDETVMSTCRRWAIDSSWIAHRWPKLLHYRT